MKNLTFVSQPLSGVTVDLSLNGLNTISNELGRLCEGAKIVTLDLKSNLLASIDHSAFKEGIFYKPLVTNYIT